MAVFSERVQIFIDFIEQRAGGKSALGSALQDIQSAEGGLNKLKAAGKGVGQAISSMGAAGWAAGLSAAAVAAGKAVDKFEQLALTAGKLSDATGLSVENASRWMEVAGDLGIGTDTIQTAFSKLNATIQSSPDKLADWGAQIVKAKDGSVDLQATILSVIGALNKLDPSARAAAMKELFGKGAVGAAELFNSNVDDIRRNLEDVSDAKLINPDEERKAKQLRDATQAIGDAWEDLQLNIGGTLADLAGFIRLMADAVGKAQELNETVKGWTGGAVDLFTGGLTGLGRAWNELTGKAHEADDATTTALANTAEGFTDAASAANAAKYGPEGFFNTITGGIQDAVDGLASIGEAYDELQGKLSDQSRALDIADDFDKVRQAAQKSFEAAASGSEEAAGAARDHQRAVIDLKKDVVDYGQKVLGLPPEKVTAILADIDNGSLSDAEKRLAYLTRDRSVSVVINGVTVGPRTRGGQVVPGGLAAAPATALTTGLLGASAGTTAASQSITVGVPVVASQPITKVDVHLPPSAQPSDVVAAIQRWAHRNGSLANAGVRSG